MVYNPKRKKDQTIHYKDAFKKKESLVQVPGVPYTKLQSKKGGRAIEIKKKLDLTFHLVG